MKPRRWYHYGEPWGLFAKVNPEATPWTVLRKALIGGAGTSLFFGALMWFGGEATPDKMKFWMFVFAVLGAFLNGLMEWQDRDDDLSDDDKRPPP